MLYDLSRKSRPEIVAAVRRPYDLCRSLNAPVPSICVLLYGQNKCNKFWPYQIRTVRILLAADLPRNPCPALPWNSCHFFAALSSSEKWKLLLLLLSLNLSISLGKNDFSFGLFPPLESLSDS
jgi:hypothetical protein